MNLLLKFDRERCCNLGGKPCAVRKRMAGLAGSLFLLTSLPSLEAQSTLVIPGEYREKQGLAYDSFVMGPRNYQVAYHGSLFNEAEARVIEVRAISFRVNNMGDQENSLSVTIPHLEVWASTYGGSILNMSVHPPDNHGEDRMLVFSADNISFFADPGATLADFPVSIDLKTSFYFDRGAGSLLLDFVTTAPYSGDRGNLDTAANNPLLRTVDGFNNLAAGHVMQLSYIPIPEPGALALLCLGALLGYFVRTRR